jgi:hypothetical protein
VNIQAHTLNTISKKVDMTMNEQDIIDAYFRWKENTLDAPINLSYTESIDAITKILSAPSEYNLTTNDIQILSFIKNETIRIMLADMRMILEKTLR